MEALNKVEKASFVLGCKLWLEDFDSLVKDPEHIIDLWKASKVKLYGEPCLIYPGRVSVISWGFMGWQCKWGAEKRWRVMGKLFVNNDLLYMCRFM